MNGVRVTDFIGIGLMLSLCMNYRYCEQIYVYYPRMSQQFFSSLLGWDLLSGDCYDEVAEWFACRFLDLRVTD